MMKITGNLIIKTAADVLKYAAITSVSGYLIIKVDFVAQALTHVGGELRIGAEFAAPALTHVGGLALPSKAEADANLRIIALADDALNMSEIRTDTMMRKLAGWACYALPGGRELKKATTWHIAGIHLLGLEAAHYFYKNDDEARKFLQQYVV